MANPSNIAQLPSQAVFDPLDAASPGQSAPTNEMETMMDRQVSSMVAHAMKRPDYGYDRAAIDALTVGRQRKGKRDLDEHMRKILNNAGHLLAEGSPANKEISYDK